MIRITKSAPLFLRKHEIWYAKKPRFFNSLNSVYVLPAWSKPVLGFIREPKYTKVIDLGNHDEESLFRSFKRETQRQINAAIRENVEFNTNKNFKAFRVHYDHFTRSKKLPWTFNLYLKESDPFLITQASIDGETLVMHLYYCDEELKRILFFHSASVFRDEKDAASRNVAGKANRFLVFKSMSFFLQQGYKTFDWGGYAYNTKDPQLSNINRFKDSFCGELESGVAYNPLLKTIQKSFGR